MVLTVDLSGCFFVYSLLEGVPRPVVSVPEGEHQPPAGVVHTGGQSFQEKPSASGAHAGGVSGATVSCSVS